ncbi:MAG TPA: hypothetical protein VEC38_08970 [Candidatus Binataceae bacterium]|nr:hypothetical protein [Candidatus Binataceae bacterium]
MRNERSAIARIFSARTHWRMVAAIVILAGLAAPQIAAAQDSAKRDYIVYCSSCHGTDGRGNGPAVYVVPGFKPTDLTVLTRTHGGQFPADEVRRIIDGRKARLPGHTDWDTNMPLWGVQFQEEGAEFTPETEARVRRRIDALVAYIRSIQRD